MAVATDIHELVLLDWPRPRILAFMPTVHSCASFLAVSGSNQVVPGCAPVIDSDRSFQKGKAGKLLFFDYFPFFVTPLALVLCASLLHL